MEKKETEGKGFPVIHDKMPSRHKEKEEKNAAALLDFLFGKAPETGRKASDAKAEADRRREPLPTVPKEDAEGRGHSGVFLSGNERKEGTKYRELKEVFHQEVLRQEAGDAEKTTEPVMEAPAVEEIPESVTEKTPEPVKEKMPEPAAENTPEPAVEDATEKTISAGFGRNSVSAEAIRRSGEVEEPEEEVEVRTEGYLPPLPMDYTPNMQIALDDCIYSMFLGEICGADDPKKYEIYFMVAPFEIHENEPSCNILMYAFYRNQNYAITSPLTNNAKNSILCQIAEFQFLIRGSFKDGVWSSDIQLTGTSLRRNDVFEITKFCHHNAKNTQNGSALASRVGDKESSHSENGSPLTAGNGHIRFTYDGYINHKEITSVGSVDIFPMDSEGQTYVIVRCMEDFTDIFYTDDPVPVELKSDGNIRILSISAKEGIVTAELKDSTGGVDGE